MQYILSNGRTIKITPLIHIKCAYAIDMHIATNGIDTDIPIDVGELDVPDNINKLLANRRLRILKGETEDWKYVDNLDILSLFGSKTPKIVEELNTVIIPKDFVGDFTVPDNTDIVIGDECKYLTGINGSLGVFRLQLASSGILNKFYIADGIHHVCLDNNKGLTDVDGGEDIISLSVRDSNIIGTFNAPHNVTRLYLSNNPNMTGLTGGEDAYIIDLRNTGIINKFIIPTNVLLIRLGNNPQLTEIVVSDGVQDIEINNTGVTGVIRLKSTVTHINITGCMGITDIIDGADDITYTGVQIRSMALFDSLSSGCSGVLDLPSGRRGVHVIESLGTKIFIVQLDD